MNKLTIQCIELTIPPFPPPINMNKLTIQHVELTILNHKHEQVDSMKQDTISMTPLKIVGQSKTIISFHWHTWKHYILGLFYRPQSEFHTLGLMYFIQNIIIYRPFDWCGWRFSTLPWNQWPAQKENMAFCFPMYVCMYVCTKDTNHNLTTRSSMQSGKQDYNGQALKGWCFLSFFCEMDYHISMPTRS